MDQVKIGKFLAELRREKSMTQELLGQKIGVTNKTISRWENGNYMPDVETLFQLSGIFQVSVNELLSGERISDGNVRKKADENLVQVWENAGFSVKERSDFWKKKWFREHTALLVTCIAPATAIFIVACMVHITWLLGLCPLGWLVLYGEVRNRMMIYAENKVFPMKEEQLSINRRRTCGR